MCEDFSKFFQFLRIVVLFFHHVHYLINPYYREVQKVDFVDFYLTRAINVYEKCDHPQEKGGCDRDQT